MIICWVHRQSLIYLSSCYSVTSSPTEKSIGVERNVDEDELIESRSQQIQENCPSSTSSVFIIIEVNTAAQRISPDKSALPFNFIRAELEDFSFYWLLRASLSLSLSFRRIYDMEKKPAPSKWKTTDFEMKWKSKLWWLYNAEPSPLALQHSRAHTNPSVRRATTSKRERKEKKSSLILKPENLSTQKKIISSFLRSILSEKTIFVAQQFSDSTLSALYFSVGVVDSHTHSIIRCCCNETGGFAIINRLEEKF